MATIVLSGSLDTKGLEYEFVYDRLNTSGHELVVIDTGTLGPPTFRHHIDITRDEVASAADASIADLAAARDRGNAVATMTRGLTAVIGELRSAGRCDAAFAMGGTGGTSVAANAFRSLPLGVPKLIVSTAASGDTSPYIGVTDLVLMPSVVDVAGLNRISTRILGSAAGALIGMLDAPPPPQSANRPVVAASMFGVTTPCVTAAAEYLESVGYEVLVFHMTGTGGRTLESLVRQGQIAGVLDVTTTELADELVGGVFSAGPERMTAAPSTGTAQVVSVGALDMVNFGATDTVPDQFRDRTFYEHNLTTTLMRTTAAECHELGIRFAERVAPSGTNTTVYLPTAGVSMISCDGQPFHDSAADQALFDAIRTGLRDTGVKIIEVATDINDSEFALAMARRLDEAIRNQSHQSTNNPGTRP